MARKTNNQTTTIAFNADELSKLGTQIGTVAAQQASQGGNIWNEVRTRFAAAQRDGKAQEAFDAIFTNGGDKVKGKKAPWYRTYKSLLNSAIVHGVTVTDDMGASALQAAVKEAKSAATSETDEQAAAILMFTRMAQGALNKGVSKAKLASVLKGLEA